jgi:hypothetical protein
MSYGSMSYGSMSYGSMSYGSMSYGSMMIAGFIRRVGDAPSKPEKRRFGPRSAVRPAQ